MAELSPMMQQYQKIKAENQGAILFFRLGDFYEMFFDDAVLASKELELTLTARDCGQDKKAPMCGVPYHSSESYIARLISKGYKVAICEQMEDPALAKGLVKRDIIRVVTPGTVLEGSMLDEGKNNFICSIYAIGDNAGICFCDISTGELYATSLDKDLENKILNELGRFSPREILIGGETVNMKKLAPFIRDKLSACVEMREDPEFDFEICRKTVLDQFKKENLDDLGLEGQAQAVSALGALLNYLKDTQRKVPLKINRIETYTQAQFMGVDLNTRRNLELLETMRNKEKRGSLLWVLDQTKTAMGKRLLRTWIEQPLLSCGKIIRRQNAVEELYCDPFLCGSLADQLTGVFDLQRLITRIVYGTANGRELRSLSATIGLLPELKKLMANRKSELLQSIYEDLDTLEDVHELIESSIVDDPPFSVREGGIIREGYNQEVDELRQDMTGGKDYVAAIEKREREKTGIPKLRIGYNRVFGYYLEVTNSYKDQVPEGYIRKQTLTNCERYVTQELKDLEGRILGAKDRCVQLEYRLFDDIRTTVSAQQERVQKTSNAIAQLDVLCSFARVAVKNQYCRPEVNLSGKITLRESRHPVVELLSDAAPFVPNDALLDQDENRVLVITGPNMAGKSTYMRQIALIALMAQLGSFVPAASAEIGLVDQIFTRVGASDDLASGQSTFMVEMNEVADILKRATSNSLLVLDEIGRGTSTFDGMSIARAVLEFVVDKRKLGAKTLFATHYHELTEMEDLMDGVKNYSIAVKKRGDDITFLRRIIRGGADDSYGIEVAKLAGLPQAVISRAKQVLKELEAGQEVTPKAKAHKKAPKEEAPPPQISLLPSAESEIEERLKKVDVNTLTPIEAMNLLFELAKMARES